MNMLNPERPIGQIGAENPRSLGVFERFGLDYCCGGARSLQQACAEADVSLDEVLSALGSMPEPGSGAERDWASATMTELADHIESVHHTFARETLERLAVLTPKVASHHGRAHPELLQLEKVVSRLREEMLDHMTREERVLFPWLRKMERVTKIRSGPPWSVRGPISCMEHDHDEVGRMLSEIRGLTNDFTPPPGACGSFRAMVSLLHDLECDTHVHVHKENNVLFPAGIRAEGRLTDASAGLDEEHPNATTCG